MEWTHWIDLLIHSQQYNRRIDYNENNIYTIKKPLHNIRVTLPELSKLFGFEG